MTDNVIMMSIIYILLIVLLIVLIVLGIKGIFAINNLNDTLDDVKKKMHSFDGTFEFIDGVSSSLSFVNKKVISQIKYALNKVKKFGKGDK